MKANRSYVDIGMILDDIFEAAKDFGQRMKDLGPGFEDKFSGCHADPGPCADAWRDENADYYPGYSYPPMNNYLRPDRSLVFEFALAGFEEKNIALGFQGDYMVFSARIDEEAESQEGLRYFKRRLKLKDVDRQKYYVPADKFAQDRVKAVFRNGILRVKVPPRDEADVAEGIKIEITKDEA